MSASRIHLVRHGEVHNPSRVLYGRLPGFRLSTLGERMAAAAALALQDEHAPVSRIIASPLQRTQESAAPVAKRFGLEVELDERLIEPANHFEGRVMARAVRDPRNWFALRNPRIPTWGEPYVSISARMLAAVRDAWDSTPEGDVVIVSHQLPIWMVHSTVAGIPLPHDPRKRRCALSSITTLERRGDGFVEVLYRDPAAGLATAATDVGAV
ncbi:histidine phosphatase family protein [Labedella phragmitis]|uniref:Histidine phosphatase family protein n=1 Tax=Labedella phragmitis TaxID=2498849 RepID=A0A3S3Z3L2_9MICO|nr:histidine phosphatase family protein [Labedella phragmitis]RWZ50993.1 histidine phosphatase family protein [Labedella phragmitis]